ncbi:MAG TPA: hypothetical protein VFO79_16025 [Xanthomonadales bacterium]|nr:hypothetical protein [Xanthomonadales bacterium]
MDDRLHQAPQHGAAFSAYAPERKAALEAKIRQWLAQNTAPEPEPLELAASRLRRGVKDRLRWTSGSAALRAIVPHAGQKIPGTGQ